jgi:outer membrane protein TolC
VPDAVACRQALVSRADILGALAEYAATQSALQLEIAKQYPDLHLNPGYEYDQGNNKWGLGLSLELPLLNHNQGPIAEAKARRAESAAKFNALQARVLSEIEQAVAGYRAAAKKAASADALSQELVTQGHAAQALLDAGEISRLELAQRQLELTTAALTQLAALVSAQAALGALDDALQSPLTLPDPVVRQLQENPRETKSISKHEP